MERLVGGDGVLEARQRRLVRPAAGGDEDMACGDGLAIDGNGVRIGELRAAADDRDSRFRQDVFVDAVEARDLPVLVGEQRRPVEAWLTDDPAVGRGDLEVFPPMRGVGEELLRNAADVDAGAAETVGFSDRDLRPVRRRDPAGANAAGAASDDEEVVIELQGFATSGS